MALSLTINKVNVAASFAAGATVANAVASGGTAPYVYSLATGGDKFAINSSTGAVTTIANMDASNIASFSVTATDSTTGTPLTITSDIVYPNIQAKVQNKFNKPNVIYKITKGINLGNGILTIPSGCTLDLQESGGEISNGVLYISSNTTIKSNLNNILNNLTIVLVTGASNIFIESLNMVGIIAPVSDSKSFGNTAILSTKGAIVSNVTIKNCIINTYNNGISLNGNNISILDNLLYNNGYSGMMVDGSVDIIASNAPTNTENNNFIIRGNRCLSKYVHRNIDVGELSSEDNIIISDNICVSSSSLTEEDATDLRKAHCIMVGYTGAKTINKVAIITNNICKNSTWSGIYVRSSNNAIGEDTNNYIALISNNYIENVNSVSDTKGGIAVELKDGSIISNNTIINAKIGISIGFIFNKSLSKVDSNYIIGCNQGIVNDTYAYHIEITNNTIKDSSKGIFVSEAAKSSLDDSHSILVSDNNISFETVVGAGITLYNVYTNNINILHNKIKAIDNTALNVGISIRTALNSGYNISNNTFENLNTGFRDQLFDISRNTSQNLDYNRFVNCVTAISIIANSTMLLYIIQGNTFVNCTAKYSDQSYTKLIYEGIKYGTGCFDIYCDTLYDYNNSTYGYIVKAEPCFLKKLFKKGDRVFSIGRFHSAQCTNDGSGTVDNDTKWSLVDGNLPTAQRNIASVTGQLLYDSTLNKMVLWNGRAWVDSMGSPVGLTRGTTAQRPSLGESDYGYMYYDNELMKYITWSGLTWMNINGTPLA